MDRKTVVAAILFLILFIPSFASAECQVKPEKESINSVINNKNKFEERGTYDDLMCLAKAYFYSGNFKESDRYYSILIKTAKTDRGISAALSGSATSKKYLGQSEEAIALLKRSLEIEVKLNDRQAQGAALANMASIYGDMGKSEESINKSLESIKFLSNQHDISATLNNVAMGYRDMNNENDSLKYINMAIANDRKYSLNDYLPIHKINKGVILGTFNKTRLAIVELTEGTSLAKEQGNLFWEMNGNYRLAMSHHRNGNQKEAALCISNAINLSKQLQLPGRQKNFEDAEKIILRAKRARMSIKGVRDE
ncbi:MAG: Tetratricopeptide repeat protein [Betaproteobacteria bacterium ADurb.Bin341]|nr:MAG: Tetratricopeptide repeat protein [Betaproteobacteria bacterium ADurb.Bin341]